MFYAVVQMQLLWRGGSVFLARDKIPSRVRSDRDLVYIWQ